MTMLLPSNYNSNIIFLYSMNNADELPVWSTQVSWLQGCYPGGQSLQTHAKSQRFPGPHSSREHL